MKLEAAQEVVDMYNDFTPDVSIKEEEFDDLEHKESYLTIRLKSGKEICAENRIYDSIASLEQKKDLVFVYEEIECVVFEPFNPYVLDTHYIPIEEIECMALRTIEDEKHIDANIKHAFNMRAELLKKRAEEESKPSTE